MKGIENPHTDEYKEITNNWNYDARCTLTSLPVRDFENFKRLIFVVQSVQQHKNILTFRTGRTWNNTVSTQDWKLVWWSFVLVPKLRLLHVPSKEESYCESNVLELQCVIHKLSCSLPNCSKSIQFSVVRKRIQNSESTFEKSMSTRPMIILKASNLYHAEYDAYFNTQQETFLLQSFELTIVPQPKIHHDSKGSVSH
jgi:hypothetical protein